MRSKFHRAVLPFGVISAAALILSIISYNSVAGKDIIAPHRLAVVFTGDILGNVKSCGCHRDGDLGGVNRHSTCVKKLRESSGNLLLLDVGDAVYGMGKYAEIKADFLAKSFPYMAYDAVALGESEVRFVRESGRSRPFGDSVVTLCANVTDASTGKPVAAEPYIVKRTSSGLDVGIIAVLGDHLLNAEMQEKLGVRVEPPEEALRRYIGELREKSDLVILLSHTGPEVARDLAAKVPGMDLILVGHSVYGEEMALERVGSVLLMQAGLSGKHVGRIALDIDSNRKIVSSAGESVPIGPEYEDDPGLADAVALHDKEMEAYYGGMRTGGSTVVLREPRPFVSASGCRECHEEEYAAWLKTDHAKAFETLGKSGQATDPECLSCHTTGFKSKGGYTSEAETRQLSGVQCEMCHGPGVIHSRRPAKGYGVVYQAVCLQCHDHAKSPKFKYSRDRQHILHSQE